MNVKVELDIFSGRPNPTWTLSPDEGKNLDLLLNSLPVTDKKINADDALGYRGFLLNIDPGTKNIPPYKVHVFNGTISIDSGDKKSYIDVHGLEKWLIRQASGRGYGAIADSIIIEE